MSVIHAPKKPELDLRVLVFPSVFTSLLMLLFLRLWYFQVVRSDALKAAAEASRETDLAKLAPRGLIFDRRGTLLAGVRPEVVVTAVPDTVRANPYVLRRVASILGVDVQKLELKVRDAAWRSQFASPIFVGADIVQGARIAESLAELPGIGVETQPMRYYPDSVSFTHVLGYVWTPSDRDVKRLDDQGLRAAPYVGKEGVERAYEKSLMGTPGRERVEIDAKGRPLRVAGRDSAVPGDQLIVSLDARLQKAATRLLGEKGFRGGVAAIDPRTGEVLCLVSGPTFDQNLYQGGISDTEWALLMNDPRKPMFNRGLAAAYPPGSTAKIVTAIAAMQAGFFNPNEYRHCAGGYRIGRRWVRCLGRHGSISFNRAMAKSCNAYFMSIGHQAGPKALVRAALNVGLGRKTGIELNGESRGVVPTDEWLAAVSGTGKPVWYGGDTLNLAIGQGYLNTTPIQMANVAALVANNGVNYRPHLVRAVKRPGGSATELG